MSQTMGEVLSSRKGNSPKFVSKILNCAVCVAMGVSLSASAAPTPDYWILAQQAFVRLDFAASFRYSSMVLAAQPSNQEARRMAAKSARELGRFANCLNIIIEVPTPQLNSDDVGIVGECAVKSKVTPRAQSLLTQQLGSADNRDIAAFWLGRQAYLKEDWAGAEKLLNSVQVLPDRLEKDRVKMLERARDVIRTTKRPAVVAEPTPRPAVQPVTQPTPQPALQPAPAPVRLPVPQVVRARKKPAFRPTAPVEKLGGSFFGSGSFRVNSEMIMASGAVSLQPFDQQEFEKSFSVEDISKKNAYGLDFGGTVALHGGYGLPFKITENFSIEVVNALEFDATMSNRVSWLYQPPTRLRYPLGSIGTVGRGLELGPVPELRISVGKLFEAEIGSRFKLNVPEAGITRTLLDFHSMLVLKNDFAELQGGYTYDRYFSSGKASFSGSNYVADFRLDKLGLFSFGAPPGYALLRYARYIALPSKHVVRFQIMEGDFLEFNVAPRVQLSESWELMAWYHWVKASRRQFWSTADIKKYYGVNNSLDESSANSALAEPTAMYSNTSSEISAGLNWDWQHGIEASFGTTYRLTKSSYVASNPGDLAERIKNKSEPDKYKELINRGGASIVRFFGNLGVSF